MALEDIAARPRMPGIMPLVVALAAVCPVSAGCSFIFMKAAPPNHAQLPYVECTSSRAAPVIDTIVAVIYAGTAVGQLVSIASGGVQSRSAAVLGGSLAIATVTGASALKGLSSAGECEAAIDAWNGRGRTPVPAACSKDIDCKGERICEAGLCVAPRPPSTSAALRLGRP